MSNENLKKIESIFKKHQDDDDSTITLDKILDELVISGTVHEVVDQILALQEKVGTIGEIV